MLTDETAEAPARLFALDAGGDIASTPLQLEQAAVAAEAE